MQFKTEVGLFLFCFLYSSLLLLSRTMFLICLRIHNSHREADALLRHQLHHRSSLSGASRILRFCSLRCAWKYATRSSRYCASSILRYCSLLSVAIASEISSAIASEISREIQSESKSWRIDERCSTTLARVFSTARDVSLYSNARTSAHLGAAMQSRLASGKEAMTSDCHTSSALHRLKQVSAAA